MACQTENSTTASVTAPPIRSILKKASSEADVVAVSDSTDLPRRKSHGRSITFNEEVVTHWSTGSKHAKASPDKSNGKTDSLELVDVFDSDEHGRRNSRSVMHQFTSGLKMKVGGVFQKLGRSHSQGDDCDEMETSISELGSGQRGVASASGSGPGSDERGLTQSCISDLGSCHRGVASGSGLGSDRRGGAHIRAQVSDISASAEHFDPTAKRSLSLPRGTSFGSSELFTRHNKSLRSKFAKLGQRFKLESRGGGSDGEPVLTKITPLAAPVEEVDAQEEDSSSDDEKGGTIKRMPKLRHVPSGPDKVEDDSEPEYHQLFEYVFVVSLKEDAKKKITTEMTYTFPPTTREFSGKDEALKSIPQFCFPDIDQWKPTKSYKSESYSFVLTDMEGNRRYGYCRRLLPEGSGPRLPEVFCIVSPLGCFALYENILDHVEERRANSSLDVFNFLKAISANPFPRPGCSVQVKVFGARGSGMETLTFKRPMDSRLEHVDFSLLFNTLSQRKIIQLFSSLLMERRVIFCAKSLSLTTGCAHALMALLYPFEWQHVFIPVLPSSLIDFVCSPLPYIIGIDPASCQRLDEMETMEEALVVHLDKGKFLRKIGDETSILPSKLFQFLEGKLSSSIITSEYSKKSPVRKAAGPSKADEIVVNTFMTFFAYLYGDYSEQVKVLKSGQKEFQRADHIKKFSSKSTRRFLEALHMTQLFENFIEQRENPSKASTVAESLFEKKLPELRERCQDIEIFSSKSRFDRWKMKKDLAKGD